MPDLSARAVRTALVPALVLALAACGDDKPSRPATATGPAATPRLSGAIAGAPADPSTVCSAYVKERDGYTDELKLAPTDERLQDQIRALDVVIADACN